MHFESLCLPFSDHKFVHTHFPIATMTAFCTYSQIKIPWKETRRNQVYVIDCSCDLLRSLAFCSEWELRGNGKRYSVEKELGRGSFATVYRATDIADNTVVAVKKVDLKTYRHKDLRRMKEKVYTERDIMTQCSHRNIVGLLNDFDAGPKEIFLVLEYCGGGDLGQFIDANPGGLGAKTSRNFAEQIACGLMYLHSRQPPIIHRDLKPANILLSAPTMDATLKITDFGEAQIKNEAHMIGGVTALNTFAGTGAYMAPEVLAKKGVDDKATYRSSGMFWHFALRFLMKRTYHHSLYIEFLYVSIQLIYGVSELYSLKWWTGSIRTNS